MQLKLKCLKELSIPHHELRSYDYYESYY